MKKTKRYLAYLVVTGLEGYGIGSILREASDTQDSDTILAAAFLTVGALAATMYVGKPIVDDMDEELKNKFKELKEKRRQKKLNKVTETLDEIEVI